MARAFWKGAINFGMVSIPVVSDSMKSTHSEGGVMVENPPTETEIPVGWRGIQRPEEMGAESGPDRGHPQGLLH